MSGMTWGEMERLFAGADRKRVTTVARRAAERVGMKAYIRPLWFPRSRLRGAPPALLGIFELPRRPGAPALELHLARPKGGGPSLAAWLDDQGRRWAIVEAGLA